MEMDEWGVPHIVADDPLAMAETYGHYEASQRLLEMDIIRRMGQGRLSEWSGPVDQVRGTRDAAGPGRPHAVPGP